MSLRLKKVCSVLDEKYPEVPAAIRDEKQISEETEKKLIQAIEEYKRNFFHEK